MPSIIKEEIQPLDQVIPSDGEVYRRNFIEDQLKASINNHSLEEDDEQKSFFVADTGEVYRQFIRWKKHLPRITPFYAIKCNPDREVIRLLASLGTGFDCSSRGEIEQVLNLGVEPNRILYANPCKSEFHLRYAVRVGMKRMTFDGVDELHKIKAFAPEAELLLRIMVDDSSSRCQFNNKFGAPLSTVQELLKTARGLNLNIVGVSFHIGSAASEPQSFVWAVRDSRIVFDQAKAFGFSLRVLDIGGGFSSGSFDIMSQTLSSALADGLPHDVELIAEPGRFFVETAFTLACNVIARRDLCNESGKLSYMLYLNDGVYGNFMDCLLSQWTPRPRLLHNELRAPSDEAIEYRIWGPTCDGVDQIIDKAFIMQIISVGDWLYFENMGAYTSCLGSNFNGYDTKSVVHYVSSEPLASALFANGER